MAIKQLTLIPLEPYNNDEPIGITWDGVRRIIDSAYPDVLSNKEILGQLVHADHHASDLAQSISQLTNLMWRNGLLHKYKSGYAVYYKKRRY